MKYSKLPLWLTLICVGIANCLPLQPVDARIGEGRESIERRLYSAGGIMYRDDTIEENRRKGMPYLQFLEYLEGAGDVRIYFKTSDGRKPKSSDMEEKRMIAGWDLHVLYVRGKSSLEVYRRSKPLSDYELNLLLAMQTDGAHWQKVNPKQIPEDAPPSLLGYEMQRSDGELRAKKIDSKTLMIFSADLDAAMAETKTADLQELAPQSVNGF